MVTQNPTRQDKSHPGRSSCTRDAWYREAGNHEVTWIRDNHKSRMNRVEYKLYSI